MFFSKLFKKRVGNNDAVLESIFLLAVILNVIGLSSSIMLLISCAFVERERIVSYIIASIITIFITFIIEILLAWMSSLLNKEKEEQGKKNKKNEK